MYNHEWVKLRDGRLGIVHHVKPDGSLAIRPVTKDHAFHPNTSSHWSLEDRLRIPEEVVVSREDAERIPTPSKPVLSFIRRLRAYFGL